VRTRHRDDVTGRLEPRRFAAVLEAHVEQALHLDLAGEALAGPHEDARRPCFVREHHGVAHPHDAAGGAVIRLENTGAADVPEVRGEGLHGC
jgi:hypothetical protein